NEVLWRRLLRAETTRRSGERGALAPRGLRRSSWGRLPACLLPQAGFQPAPRLVSRFRVAGPVAPPSVAPVLRAEGVVSSPERAWRRLPSKRPVRRRSPAALSRRAQPARAAAWGAGGVACAAGEAVSVLVEARPRRPAEPRRFLPS